MDKEQDTGIMYEESHTLYISGRFADIGKTGFISRLSAVLEAPVELKTNPRSQQKNFFCAVEIFTTLGSDALLRLFEEHADRYDIVVVDNKGNSLREKRINDFILDFVEHNSALDATGKKALKHLLRDKDVLWLAPGIMIASVAQTNNNITIVTNNEKYTYRIG